MVPFISLAALVGPQEHRPGASVPRPVESTDLMELTDLYLRSYHPEADRLDAEKAAAKISRIFAGTHGNPIPQASLAIVNAVGQIIAAILVTDRHVGSATPGTAYIAELFTHPDHRRQGLAEDLLRRAMDVLHTLGHRTVAVTVHSANAPAMALYLSRDFRRLTQRAGDD
ncbi:GNAT family N-acetyltransferase [Arthrobacter sp. NPDC093139]|uniref:GNAT family N-acetyltransferase n=1 Tax=Arthrobacter sp. NPDC093139 TaxID=3363945 RepID=UPI00381485DC